MTREYRCVYEVDVTADSPEEAALTAHELMQSDPGPVIQVVEWGGAGRGPQIVDPGVGELVDLQLVYERDLIEKSRAVPGC